MLRKDLSDSHNKIYEAGPWYVRVNHVNRKCQVTSGDIWFDATRKEAAEFLKDCRSQRKQIAA
jgi:hypothetical protein